MGVQGKLPCLFQVKVEDVSSDKRPRQKYRVVATSVISEEAIRSKVQLAVPTEKIDGTCCYIGEVDDKLLLFARLDRKPTKAVDKIFKIYQNQRWKWLHENQDNSKTYEPSFKWNYPKDFKEVPLPWMPAFNVERDTDSGLPLPDENGHIPGWVSIDQDKRQYCWHHSVVNFQNSIALVLRSLETASGSAELELSVTPMSSLVGKTLELIGTNINGNPYGLGSKMAPFHALVIHGDIKVQHLPQKLDYAELKNWFIKNESYGCIEGIVWHCGDNRMFKVHRQHLNLKWPEKLGDGSNKTPFLCQQPVKINSEILQIETDESLGKNTQFCLIKQLHNHYYGSLLDIPWQ